MRSWAALLVVALSGCNTLLGITDPTAANTPVDGDPGDDGGDDGGGGNAKPTVSIVTPTNNAVVANFVNVMANASDPDGTIVSVKFDLPDGSSETDALAPFSTSWNSATVPDGAGKQVKATATDNMGATGSATATFTVRNVACIDDTFAAAGLPITIPDDDVNGITSNLSVAGNGNIASLSLSLHITHTFRGDLVVTLISPAGTMFVVSNKEGSATDDIVITDQTITTFDGAPAAGTWKMFVQDEAVGDTGTIDTWSLKILGDCN